MEVKPVVYQHDKCQFWNTFSHCLLLVSFLQIQWCNSKVLGPVFMAQIIHVIISSSHINFSKISFAKHGKSLRLRCVLLTAVVQILQSRWSGKCAFSNTCSALSLAMVGDMKLWSFVTSRALLLVKPSTWKPWNPFLPFCQLHFSAWGHLQTCWGCTGYHCVTDKDIKEPWGTPLLTSLSLDRHTDHRPSCIHAAHVQNAQKMRQETAEEWSEQQSYFHISALILWPNRCELVAEVD